MRLRRWSSALVVLSASPAAADPQFTTPTGGGCQANGLAVAGFAGLPGPFGEIVRDAAPIADQNAAFFDTFCR